MKHVVLFSGGVNSWAAAKRVAERFGTADLSLVFADTGIEDEDLYRFLKEAAANVGGTFIRVAEGRTPWQVFFDKRFLGNHRVDPCSRILKRELLDAWLTNNRDPADTLIAYGFDWSEGHRMARMLSYGGPYERWAPLLEKPYIGKAQMLNMLRTEGIRPPRLYDLGFQHNNCGGTCVKAGQAAWALLLRTMPDRYREWEENEERFRSFIGHNVSILTDRRGDGVKKPLTLRAFRESLQCGAQYDMFDWGSCGCFQVQEAAGNVDGAIEALEEARPASAG